MHITIALRFKPFSHQPGTTCLIPGTPWRVQIFPTFARFIGPYGTEIRHAFSHQGPLEGFTVQQDLEKSEVRVFGKSVSYCIQHKNGAIELLEGKKEPIRIVETALLPKVQERLSMGVHKQQEWEGIRRRADLGELLPIWFALGARTPCEVDNRAGSTKLLDECIALSEERRRHDLELRLRHLFLAGFSGLFDPRLHDSEHQGILSDHPVEDLHGSLQLLKDGAKFIRAMFFKQEGGTWHLLPCLLPSFHAGRFTDLHTEEGDRISLEWSKGLLRRVIIHPVNDHSIMLDWPKELRHGRIRTNLQEKGRPLQRGASIELKSGRPIFLDCFQK